MVAAKKIVPDLRSHRKDAIEYWQVANHKTKISGGDKKSLSESLKPNLTPAQILIDVDNAAIMSRFMETKRAEESDALIQDVQSSENQSTSQKKVEPSECNVICGIHQENLHITTDDVIRAECYMHGVQDQRKGIKFHIHGLLEHYVQYHGWSVSTALQVKRRLPKSKQYTVI